MSVEYSMQASQITTKGHSSFRYVVQIFLLLGEEQLLFSFSFHRAPFKTEVINYNKPISACIYRNRKGSLSAPIIDSDTERNPRLRRRPDFDYPDVVEKDGCCRRRHGPQR